MSGLREDVIAEAVPVWLETNAAILTRRAWGKDDTRRKGALYSVDDVLRLHGIGTGTDFDSLALYARYESAIRERAREVAGA